MYIPWCEKTLPSNDNGPSELEGGYTDKQQGVALRLLSSVRPHVLRIFSKQTIFSSSIKGLYWARSEFFPRQRGKNSRKRLEQNNILLAVTISVLCSVRSDGICKHWTQTSPSEMEVETRCSVRAPTLKRPIPFLVKEVIPLPSSDGGRGTHRDEGDR